MTQLHNEAGDPGRGGVELLQHLGVKECTSPLEAVGKTIARTGADDHGPTPSEKVALYSYTSTDDCYTINREPRRPAPKRDDDLGELGEEGASASSPGARPSGASDPPLPG